MGQISPQNKLLQLGVTRFSAVILLILVGSAFVREFGPGESPHGRAMAPNKTEIKRPKQQAGQHPPRENKKPKKDERVTPENPLYPDVSVYPKRRS